MMPLEPLRQLRAAGGSRPIDLGAIAGREDHRLRQPLVPAAMRAEPQSAAPRERYLFAQASGACGDLTREILNAITALFYVTFGFW